MSDASTTHEATAVLIVDDESVVQTGLSTYLHTQGFAATGVGTLNDARALLERDHFDIVVLDLNLGRDNGIDLLRELAVRQAPPVLVCSSRGEETDRILGIELGADDYLVKPFAFRELAARIRGVLRRTTQPRRTLALQRHAKLDRWTIDISGHVAHDDSGRSVEFTAGEMALLRAFLDHPRRALWRHELLALTRFHNEAVFPRTVDVLMTRLRHKLERDVRRPSLIHTIRGQGYRLDADVIWQLSE